MTKHSNFASAVWRLVLTTLFIFVMPGVQHAQAGLSEVTTRGTGVQSRFDPKCGASAECKIWEQFRRGRPFPVQTIAGRVMGDRLLLVFSEPTLPPKELERILRVSFGEDFVKMELRRWMIGADGWLQDAVVTVRWRGVRTSSEYLRDAQFRDRLSLVAQQLWGTSFGLDVEPIERNVAVRLRGAAPDLDPRPAEVAQWMQDTKQRWSPIDSTVAGRPLSELTATEGAYFSSDGHLVILMISPDAVQLARTDSSRFANQWRPLFRRFAVSSDVIVGSSWSTTGSLAVVARRRQVTPDVMPPLRFETFATLVEVQARELAQSYERTTPSAGKLKSGPYSMSDWAPIYLSQPLINSEFGALLNITDQMLKSWSSAGQIQYLYFDYPGRPRPGKFAFGASSIADIIQRDTGSEQVLFNWNTAGAASIVSFDHREVIVPNRTGALPVTYGAELIPGKGVEVNQGTAMLTYENKAYDYFAGLRDPNLSRVMSYTVLYQAMDAFKQARIPAGSARTTSGPAPRQASMDAIGEIVAGVVKDLTAADAMQRVAKTWIDNLEQNSKSSGKLNEVERARLEAFALLMADQVLADAQERIQRIRTAEPRLAEPHTLAAVLVDRSQAARLAEPYEARQRKFTADVASFNRAVDEGTMTRPEAESRRARLEKEVEALKRLSANVKTLLSDIQGLSRMVGNWLDLTQDLDKARVRFVEGARGEPQGWIRTPSIVISWDTENIASVGGHNLDAQALRIQVDPAVTGATIEQSATGSVLRVPPSQADAARTNASRLVRRVEHERIDDAAIRKILADMAPLEARPMTTALQVDAGKPTLPLGGSHTGRLKVDEGLVRTQMLADFDAHGRPRMLVVRDSGGDYIIATRDGEIVQCCVRALDISSLRDTLVGMKGKGDVVLKDFPERQAYAIRRNLQVQDDQILLEAVGGSGSGNVLPPHNTIFAFADAEPPGKPPSKLVGVRAGRGKPSEVLFASNKERHLLTVEGPLNEAHAKAEVAKLDVPRGSPAAMAGRPWNTATDGRPTVFRLTWRDNAELTSARTEQTIIAGVGPEQPAVGTAVVKEAIDKARIVEKQSPAQFVARVKELVDNHRDRKSVRRLYSWVEENRVAYLLSQAETTSQTKSACNLLNC